LEFRFNVTSRTEVMYLSRCSKSRGKSCIVAVNYKGFCLIQSTMTEIIGIKFDSIFLDT